MKSVGITMSKVDSFNILLYGDDDAVFKFRNYLGFENPGKNALVYFEFPNEKFVHKDLLKLFNYKLRIYLLQPLLLSTIITPKKEFREADALIMVINNANFHLSDECIEYISKISNIRKSFTPLLLIGMNCNGNATRRDLGKFFYNLHLSNTFHKAFGIPTYYFDINEEENEATFFRRLPELLESTKSCTYKEYTSSTMERMIAKLLSRLHVSNELNYDLEQGIQFLAEFEHFNKVTITRHSLELIWGLNNAESKTIIEYWDKHVSPNEIPKDELDLLIQEANIQLNKCIQYHFEPNLVNLLSLGNTIEESKSLLAILKLTNQIESISYHNPTIEYEIYDNLQDLIILHIGRHIYTRTKSDSNEITIFSGLMQTMEIVRNKYLKSGENGNKFLEVQEVDYLDFGNLHAILGTGTSGVKVILRFKKHPEKIYLQKTQEFIQVIETQFEQTLQQRVIDLMDIKSDIDTLFYKYFNPFPESIPYDRILSVSESQYEIIKSSLTPFEETIISAVIEESQMTINQILTHISRKSDGNISESDVLSRVIDLIEEKILE